MGKLTQAHIRAALSKPGRHHDGDGLILFVRESGQASWVARIQQGGARREFGLGGLKAVGLREAREKAMLVKAALVAGRDPHLELKPPKEMTRTFREAALGFLDAKSADAKISDAKYKQNLSQLKAYAFPALGKLQVQSIDADAIATCLRPIWSHFLPGLGIPHHLRLKRLADHGSPFSSRIFRRLLWRRRMPIAGHAACPSRARSPFSRASLVNCPGGEPPASPIQRSSIAGR